jgi:Phage tail tube protein
MAIRSGIAAQLGVAAETTYGTYATPTVFYEMESETLKNSIDRMEVQDLRSGSFVTRTDRWAAGRQNISGDVSLSVRSNGFAKLFHHCLGTVSNVAAGTGFTYSCIPGDLTGLSLTTQVGRPDLGGTVQPFSYTGCKVSSFNLSNTSSDEMKLQLTLDGQAETTAQSLAGVSYTASMEPLYFTEGVISIAGANTDIINWSVTGNNAMKTDRFYVSATTPALKREPVRNAYSQYAGTLVADFNTLTQYNRFVNGTVATIVLTYTGLNTVSGTYVNNVVVTIQNARFDGDTPNVSGPDVLQQSLPFVCLDDGVNAPLKIQVTTADGTATV